MAGYLTAPLARIKAILAGTYPAAPGPTDRQIPPATFAAGSYRLPLENPAFPAVTFERRFDLFWVSGKYTPGASGSENQSQGPHLRELAADLLVSYAITLPPTLTPPAESLLFGALTAASTKAAEDEAVVEWALCWKDNWLATDIVSIARRADWTCKKADTLRLVLTVPLDVIVQVAGVTSPGLG